MAKMLWKPNEDQIKRSNITQFMDCSKVPIRSVVDYDIRERNFPMTVIGGKLVHGGDLIARGRQP